MTYNQAAAKIKKARSATDLFGTDPVEAQRLYRKLSKLTHPDTAKAHGAAEVFARLSVLWADLSGSGASDGRFTIQTRKRTYVASAAAYWSEIATVYPCVWAAEDGSEAQGLMKMPRSPRDSDLMQAEAQALKTLGGTTERYRVFVPSLVESFRHRDAKTKVERRVNVVETSEDRFYSLVEIRRAYPNGVNAKDVAWMWRRLLTAIGYAHRHEIVHGAVLPENVLIHPGEHGLVLTDWCYSVPMKTPLRAMVEGRAFFYPPEVMKKESATQATDIHMAAQTMGWLMTKNAPKQLRAFIRGCTLESQSMRPHDAWDLLREFDELIERLWGPRKFRTFTVPDSTERFS